MQPLVIALLVSIAQLNQPATRISVVVVDLQGTAVAGAVVRAEVAGRPVDEGRTALDGSVELTAEAGVEVRLTATASGFAPASVALDAGAKGPVQIMLRATPFFEGIQVTSSREEMPQADPSVTTTVIASSPLRTRAALGVDDALKMVPGFTLTRRSSSRVANPGSQAMTIRGLGGSGASRSLVLADGVPLNDPFAGWVYWDKVPQSSIDRIEILRGGGSDLYGGDAVGGVVQILTLRPRSTSLRALVEGGSLGTGRVSLFAGSQKRGWNVSGAGEWFTIDGYIPVAEDERGPVDTRAGSTHRSGFGALGYQAVSGWRFEARASLFSEDRANGTPAQVNDTSARQVSGEVVGPLGGGLLSTRVFGNWQRHHQTFSVFSIEPPRFSEDLNRIDHVPTSIAGVAAQWTYPWGRHTLLVGGEGRVIAGDLTEIQLSEGRELGTSEAGGRQRLGAVFARATLVVGDRLTVAFSARGDGWYSESQDGSSADTVGAFSPRASIAYRVGDTGLTVRGSAYGGFRPPTLNELYRGFRVGNTVTNPNAGLAPETLRAGEGGLLFSRGRVSARATGFWNLLDHAVTNVTLSTSPSLNIRQRQNADTVRSMGVEFEGTVRLPKSISVAVTNAFTNARFTGDTTLADFRVPQVPSYNLGVNVRYDDNVWVASGQLRVTGPQYEDDVNTLVLRRATVVDLLGGRTIGQRVNVFIAVENVFDSDYDVGRVPARTIGLPRAVRGGFQLAVP